MSPTVHRFASTHGADVVAFDWGEGRVEVDRRPILLIVHATGLHGRVYDPLVPVLGRRFRCIALDLRGHGQARRPDGGDFSWQGMTDDVLCALDGLGLVERADVRAFGHSMGGCAITRAEIVRPGAFAGLFLFEPIIFEQMPGNGGAGSSNAMADAARRRRDVFPSRSAAVETYASKRPWSTVDRDALEAYVRHGFVDLPDGSVRLACRPADEAAVFEQSVTDTAARIGEVAIPVTLAAGARSEPMHVERIGQLASGFRHAQTMLLPDRTHFGPFERVADFAEVVLQAFDAQRAFETPLAVAGSDASAGSGEAPVPEDRPAPAGHPSPDPSPRT